MAPGEDHRLKVRHARLDDAPAICSLHRSHVDRWCRRVGVEVVDVPYASLSPGERWGHGGPWMSGETCAVHLNNLLLEGHFALVAEAGGQVVGEMELFPGEEGAPYGKNLHVGLLYVRKGRTGEGIGRALMDRAFLLAGGLGRETVTVASAAENAGFYGKCGFEGAGSLVELEAAVKPYAVAVAPMPPPASLRAFVRGLPMPIGRYQSSAFHAFEQIDRYAIPEFLECRRDLVFAAVDGHPSLFAFTRRETEPPRADVYAWTAAGAASAAKAALALLHRAGVGYATILLAGDDYYALADEVDAAVKGTRGILLRRLKS